MIFKLVTGAEFYLSKLDYKMLKVVIKKKKKKPQNCIGSSFKNVQRVRGPQQHEAKPLSKRHRLAASIDTVQEPKKSPSLLICGMWKIILNLAAKAEILVSEI